MRIPRRLGSFPFLLAAALAAASHCFAQTNPPDPLASWNDGPAKQAIVKFVAETTKPGAPGFVPPDQRVATFDNDGTLWAEQPIYFQFAFGLDRAKAMAPKHPEWKTTEPYKSLLAGDLNAVLAQGDKAVLSIMMASHAGVTTEEFNGIVADWLATARHPRFQRPYTDLVYQPMLELLAYMRANGFKTFIVSGGGVEFMRVFAEKVYGIPPEQVVGSSIDTKFEQRPGGPVLMRMPRIEFVDDGPGKPVGINRFIGRRPVFSFGNSDGDQQMLEWAWAGAGTRFCGIVHHTDAAREWAYDHPSHIGQLDKALVEAKAKGWVVVDMKSDWKRIFPFEK
ncbi:MAG TPA: HAD family hydrolase [Thermoanaerobaculia bacterium]|jgi:phosphoglycolate phosphatase-like HAD superfamily hydrolase